MLGVFVVLLLFTTSIFSLEDGTDSTCLFPRRAKSKTKLLALPWISGISLIKDAEDLDHYSMSTLM